MIVSNPPYVVSSDIDGLQPEVRNEPRLALDGGEDGLEFYRKICAEAPRVLRAGGLLLMEMGAGQKEAIQRIIEERRDLSVREVVRDYNGIERVIIAQERAHCHGQTADRRGQTP
jgi:release factor glutamine methyltransferase